LELGSIIQLINCRVSMEVSNCAAAPLAVFGDGAGAGAWFPQAACSKQLASRAVVVIVRMSSGTGPNDEDRYRNALSSIDGQELPAEISSATHAIIQTA
jgi:hypothetical protein